MNTTKLIALVAIAAGSFAGLAVDIAEGAAFEVDSTVAEGLIAQGIAKLDDTPDATKTPRKPREVQVRVLIDCALGKANDVVTVSAANAKAAEASGQADAGPAAVAYALTLDQNQPQA